MLHRTSPRIFQVLVYAVLEWILILLLLLNSLLSYLTNEFANYFGLKPPCSRLDQILQSNKHVNSSIQYHVCEGHAVRISELTYCSTHKKLSESQSLCADCSLSQPVHNAKTVEISSDHVLFTSGSENAAKNEENKWCCRHESFNRKLYSPLLLFKPFRNVLDHIQKWDSFMEVRDEIHGEEDSDTSSQCKLVPTTDLCSLNLKMEERQGDPNGDQRATEDFKGYFVEEQTKISEDSASSGNEEQGLTQSETTMVPKEMLMLENIELVAEDSLDGSIIGETEVEYESLTSETMTAKLKAQQKALRKLYAELEKERSANCAAANETLSMITRLQEEKAAVQMEALQYQRMMEEQAEYDQEALQLLNDLTIKREKEKQELENELQVYRKKVLVYESREKFVWRSMTSTSTSPSSNSTSDCKRIDEHPVQLNREEEYDNDEHSVYLNKEKEYEEASFDLHQGSYYNNSGHAPNDIQDDQLECCSYFNVTDISTAEFEEERLCILEELKALEAKLFALGDDEQQLSADIKPIENHMCANEKEYDETYSFFGAAGNSTLHMSSDILAGENHSDTKDIGCTAKRLLPLLDAIETESVELELNEMEINKQPSGMINNLFNGSELKSNEHSIQNELYHVYQRLQDLEADSEFVKHCLCSMKKGDKGLVLLQEILQHIRDLKSVELYARNLSESPAT